MGPLGRRGAGRQDDARWAVASGKPWKLNPRGMKERAIFAHQAPPSAAGRRGLGIDIRRSSTSNIIRAASINPRRRDQGAAEVPTAGVCAAQGMTRIKSAT